MGTLSDNIKKYRLLSNLNQEELATMLGKSKNVISNWERGDNKPDADIIEKMCTIFKIEPNQLHGWAPSSHSSNVNTVAAHFDGEDYTESELEEIKENSLCIRYMEGTD